MSIELPQRIPVMILSSTVLFPQTVIPLYIFEPRYRCMLVDTLAGHRVFAVAKKKDQSEANADELPASIATAGLVRLSSQNGDGTSNVLLQGFARIGIDAIFDDRPYPVAEVTQLRSFNSESASRSAEQRQRLLELITNYSKTADNQPDHFFKTCESMESLEDLSYFIAQAFCDSAVIRQRFLETMDTNLRAQRLIEFLGAYVSPIGSETDFLSKLPQEKSAKN